MYEKRSQNFFRNEKLVKHIIKLSGISFTKKQVLIEIGPGKGIITKEILKQKNEDTECILVEKDPKIFNNLKYLEKDFKNLSIINMDFLEYRLPKKKFSVISNLPFYCTSDILRKLLNPNSNMQEALLVMQKEAADMFTGSRGNTLKSLKAYPFWNVEVLYHFNRKDFKPAPNVDTVLVKFTRKEDIHIQVDCVKKYYKYIENISKDRVDEGIWKKIYNKKERHILVNQIGLVKNRGISIQEPSKILEAFKIYTKAI